MDPPLSEREIALVSDTFSLIRADAIRAGMAFYDHLFRRAPHLRGLFPPDLADQGVKLIETLDLVVGNLHSPEFLVPLVEQVAREHVEYGVEPAHYGLVGAAMIDTFAEALGPVEFDDEARAAWSAAYALLSRLMIAAAYPSRDAA